MYVSPSGRPLEPGVEIGPRRHPQRRLVAVELQTALAPGPNPERRRQARENAPLVLEFGDVEVGRRQRESLPVLAHALLEERRAVRRDATHRPEHRREDRQRVDADVHHWPRLVQRLRRGMPGLDPAPVRLGVDRAHSAEAALPDELPGGLLRLAEQRRGRTAQADAVLRCGLCQLARLVRAQGDRLLRVDVLAGLEARLRHRRVRHRRGEIGDDVDPVVREHRFERLVFAPAVCGDELGGAPRQDVRGAGERQPRLFRDAPCVARGDVSGTDEGDVHASHPSSCARIARTSSVGSKVSGSCSTAIAPA